MATHYTILPQYIKDTIKTILLVAQRHHNIVLENPQYLTEETRQALVESGLEGILSLTLPDELWKYIISCIRIGTGGDVYTDWEHNALAFDNDNFNPYSAKYK